MVDNHVLPSPLSRSEGGTWEGARPWNLAFMVGGSALLKRAGRDSWLARAFFALFETLTYSATAGRRRAGVGRKCDSCARRSGTSSRGTATGMGRDVTCEWYVRL